MQNKLYSLTGRRKTWWHLYIRGHEGRNLGIIENDGEVWTVQRRFSLKELKDLGFGRKSLDSVMIYEADEVIDKMLEKKVNEMDITFNIAVINVLFEIVGSKRFDPNSTGQKFQKEIVVSSILHKFFLKILISALGSGLTKNKGTLLS